LATGAWDAVVKLWSLGSVASGEETPLLELYDHEAPVCCVALNGSATLLAAGAEDGRLLVWDARAGGQCRPIGAADVDGSASRPVAAVDVLTTDGGERVFAAAEHGAGQDKRAKFPTSKAHISAVFHSFRLIFGRAIISRDGLEAWMLVPERARAEHSR
jgi:WD40 repeat protein